MPQDYCPKTTVPRPLSQDHCPKTTVPRPLSQDYCPKTTVPRSPSQDHCPKTTVPRPLSQDHCPKTTVPRMYQDCSGTRLSQDCTVPRLSQDCPKTALLLDCPQTALSQDFFGTVPRLVTKCLDSRISSSSLWGLLNQCTVYHHLSSSKVFPKNPFLMAKSFKNIDPPVFISLSLFQAI